MTIAQRSTAARLLASKGQHVTLAYVGTSAYDPATGETSNTAPDPVTVDGAFIPLSAIRYAFKQSSGVIVEGDQQLLLSAIDTSGAAIPAPQVNGTVTDANNDTWTLITSDPLAPAGLNIMFDCTVRRAA